METFIQENIKTIRHILGYTQTELANKLGITRVYLGQLESNKTKLQRTVAIALITIIIYNSEQLDKDSMTYKLISVYVEEFRNMILKMV